MGFQGIEFEYYMLQVNKNTDQVPELILPNRYGNFYKFLLYLSPDLARLLTFFFCLANPPSSVMDSLLLKIAFHFVHVELSQCGRYETTKKE